MTTTSLSTSLLESGQGGSTSRKAPSLPVRVVAATLACCTALFAAAGVFLGGAEFGRETPHAGSAYGISLKAVNASRDGTATLLAAGLNADCYTYTGGTCHIDACDPKRAASCEDGLCMCVSSGCAGVDGVCYQAKNQLVAAGFTLMNVKFSMQRMYMPATDPFSHIKTTAFGSMFNFGKDKWMLHSLPGRLAGQKEYFLTTERFPDYVATVRATLGTAFSPFGAYEEGLEKEASPDSLAVRVCFREDNTLMIGSVGMMGTQWFYLHHGTWEIFTWSIGDPGPGGYWIADPPIDQEALEPCGDL